MQDPQAKDNRRRRYARRKKAAQYACVSVRKLDALIHDRQIPCIRVGSAVLVDLDDIDIFYDRQKHSHDGGLNK